MITWPKEWDPEEGWGERHGRPLTMEQRQWSYISRLCHNTREERIASLGGRPGRILDRDLGQVAESIQVYYLKYKKRPTTKSPGGWGPCAQWLRSQGTSLTQLCDEMGLPGTLERTLRDVKGEIRSHYNEYGSRPTQATSREWANWDSWLRRQGSSLSQLCGEMGLPGLNLERTSDQAKKFIRAYYKEHGKCPTQKEAPAWSIWLFNRGTSLRQLCDEMGVPSRYALTRTLGQVKKEIRSHYKTHGKRPTQATSREWANWDSWLRRQGSSLSKLCDEMGLSVLRRSGEDPEAYYLAVQKEARSFKKRMGKRPTGSTKGWSRHDHFLRKHKGMGLGPYLDSVGIR